MTAARIGSEIPYGQFIERPPGDEVADHPAKFSDVIITHAFDMLWPYVHRGRIGSMFDPFAGVGRCHIVASNLTETTRHPVVSIGIEIQPRWAAADRRTIVGNVLHIPLVPMWGRGFDCVFTSPCYGNRMADHHDARDDSTRNTYTHRHGEPLDVDNAGRLQWGKEYRRFHRDAWARVVAQLRFRGLFLLNISDHYRGPERQFVSKWHHDTLTELGLVIVGRRDVKTPRQRNGANGQTRVECEHLLMYDKRRR